MSASATPNQSASHIGVVNGGSSTVKWAVHTAGPTPSPLARGQVSAADRDQALEAVANVGGPLTAVVHRIVHGGPRFRDPVVVTPDVTAELQKLIPLSPTHLPAELELISAFTRRFPGIPQVACFDTAFFADLPLEAQLLPLPRRYYDAGVRRYGFHGLSYTGLMDDLRRTAPEVASGRIILAHLGNGCSMAAVHAGKPVDVSMAFTPAAGLVMGTRTGDLDPGVLVHLIRTEGLSADDLDDLIHRQSGLLGVSGTTSDMRELLAKRNADSHAAEAVALFCRQARKYIGAFAAVLGGVDALVFSGGIGEHASEIRAEIVTGLDHLGLRLDPTRNPAAAGRISPDGATAVFVIPADEERVMAAAAARLLGI